MTQTLLNVKISATSKLYFFYFLICGFVSHFQSYNSFVNDIAASYFDFKLFLGTFSMVVNIALLSKCPFLLLFQVLNNKIGFLAIFFMILLFNISLGLMDRNSEISHRFSLGFVYLSLENTLCSFRHHQLEIFALLKFG